MDRRDVIKMLGAAPLISVLGNPADAVSQVRSAAAQHQANTYQLVIFGGTPGGLALALRAAREGLTVLLVNHNQHLGGMFVNGLGTMDTLYNGARSPLYDELRYDIYDYYRKKYGKKSPQLEASQPGFPKTRYESHVMEEIVNTLVQRESNITVLKDHYPVKVERSGRKISSVAFQLKKSEQTISVKANVFADCSYEGDLAFVSKTPVRIGRESKDEFKEKHAGITYMTTDAWPAPPQAAKETDIELALHMNLVTYDAWSDLIMPQSTGAAHEAIQAFNIRSTLTSDPENRVIPGKPEKYDPDYLREKYGTSASPGLTVPNSKTSWNYPELIGLQNPYIEGNWVERDKITDKFREDTLAWLYFLQNDPSVPEKVRERMSQYGLSKNEYPDNGHVPYEIYVREGRRIEGRAVFTENSALLATGIERAPVYNDSISVTEWFMDSHACTEHTLPGSKPEGEVMLKNKTFPGQVSFNTIFPKDLDNLIVPVCLSSSHIGWGTIRLEPTWMSICEAAGYIVSLAIKGNMAPPEVEKDKLMRLLARKRIMISFFNDVEGREYMPWYPAIQYLGTKGFFGCYDARPDDLLTRSLGEAWLLHTSRLLKNRLLNPMDHVAEIYKKDSVKDEGMKASTFLKTLTGFSRSPSQKMSELTKQLRINPDSVITRGEASMLIFETIADD